MKEKRRRDRLMEVAEANPESWAVGFLDECWWSRLALPTLNSWSQQGKPLRLIQKSVAKDDPEPKAISCYGLYVPQLDQSWSCSLLFLCFSLRPGKDTTEGATLNYFVVTNSNQLDPMNRR